LRPVPIHLHIKPLCQNFPEKNFKIKKIEIIFIFQYLITETHILISSNVPKRKSFIIVGQDFSGSQALNQNEFSFKIKKFIYLF